MSRFHRFIYPAYVRMTRANPHRSYRMTEEGRFLQLGVIATATLGIDTDLTLSYQLFALLLCCYVFSRIASRFGKPRLTVERRLPRFVTAGEPFSYQILVRNQSDRVESDLMINDLPAAITPGLDQYLDAREPVEHQRNGWDQLVGYHRFVWLQRLMTGLTIDAAQIPTMPVGGEVHAEVEGQALRRGVVRFQQINVSWPDPLGLVRRILQKPRTERLLVLPRRYRISDDYRPPGGRHYQPGGVNETRSIGESDEFVALRDYREGDMVRSIHWPSTAKMDSPVVKEFQDEYFVRQALLLDNCVTDPELLEEAVSVAASFAVRLNTADSLLDLMFLADGARSFTAGRGLAHSHQILEVLAGVQSIAGSFAGLSEIMLGHARVLSGCLLVLTDWDAARQTLVERLSQLKLPHEVLIVTRREIPAQPGIHVLKVGQIQQDLDLIGKQPV